MKEATIYKTFAAVCRILAGSAIYAIITGHYCHIFTLAALCGLAYLLDREADKLDKTENSKTIEQ